MAHDPAASLSPRDDSVKVWGAALLFTVSIWVKAKYWPVILVSKPLVSHAVAAGPCSLCFSCCLCQERESHYISWYSGKCLLFCFTWCFFLYLKKWRLLDVNFIPSICLSLNTFLSLYHHQGKSCPSPRQPTQHWLITLSVVGVSIKLPNISHCTRSEGRGITCAAVHCYSPGVSLWPLADSKCSANVARLNVFSLFANRPMYVIWLSSVISLSLLIQ